MEPHLRAGVAIYNEGDYHAAHDAWEDRWLALDSGTDDERFLHGLIQFTAAVFHARDGNWSGATGLAESGRDYLAPLDATYRSVNVGDVREYLAALARDPELIERREPLGLTHDGVALRLDELDFEPTTVAAAVLAEEHGYDEAVIADAARYARTDLDAGRSESPFVTFLFDFVREAESREVIATRLADHVKRRRRRESNVDGLFD